MRYRLKDLVNPLKWRAVYQAYKMRNEGITLAYCEQVVDRSIKCSDCVAAGKCSHCGCSMPGAILAKDNFCSQGKWGPMLDQQNWDKYKERNDIKIEIK